MDDLPKNPTQPKPTQPNQTNQSSKYADSMDFFAGQSTQVYERVGVKNTTYQFVLTSPAVASMSCSHFLDGLWDGW